MLPSESPIFAEQDDIYIYFFTAYGWPVRLEIQNPFFGPKSARVTKGFNNCIILHRDITDTLNLSEIAVEFIS